MNRDYHLLKTTKVSKTIKNLVFYDTETSFKEVENNLIEHTLRLGWLCYCKYNKHKKLYKEYWYYFTKPEEFWQFLFNLQGTHNEYYIFSHNQHFDFSVINGWYFIDKYKMKVNKFIIDSNKFILEISYMDKTYIFVDTMNLCKFSIKEIGDSLNLKKLSVDFENASEEELKTYCKRDVEIIKEFIFSFFKFLKEHNYGTFKLTLASQAFEIYRHKFYKNNIYIHNKEPVIELERNSYRGGRNEAYYIGKVKCDEIYKLDVNSMYPYVMKNFKYPTKLLIYSTNEKLDDFKDNLSHYEAIAKCNITINKPAIGVKSERLIFPIGTFDCYITKPEIEYVLKEGKINKVYEVAYYDSDNLFSDFVDELYNLRIKYKQEGNKIYELIAKLILNSLYGKFGEKRIEWIEDNIDIFPFTGIIDVANVESGEQFTYLVIGNNCLRKMREEESYNSFPAIASYITSYSRMYLWELIEKANKDNVYYVDTDSLFTNKEGYENLKPYINPTELGKLKLESVHKQLIIYGCKDYILDNEKKIKGIKPNAEWISDSEAIQEQFLKTLTLLRKGNLKNITLRKVLKQLSREYKKGVVTSSGVVLPFQFS